MLLSVCDIDFPSICRIDGIVNGANSPPCRKPPDRLDDRSGKALDRAGAAHDPHIAANVVQTANGRLLLDRCACGAVDSSAIAGAAISQAARSGMPWKWKVS